MGKKFLILMMIVAVIYTTFISRLNGQQVVTLNWPAIEMKAINPSIKVGEPLILELKYVFSTPRLAQNSEEILKSYNHGDVGIRFYIKNSKGENTLCQISAPEFPCKDGKGLIYTGYVNLFFFMDTSEKAKLLFSEQGKYTVTIFAEQESLKEMLGDKAPKPLVVDVKPAGEQEKKALSILTGEFDLLILESPDSDMKLTEYPDAMERFKQVVEQCPDTMLAKMAAARLGIERVKELEKKYGSEESLEKYRKTDIKDPLVESTNMYLKLAYQLPDEFPVRENVLYGLIQIDYINGNATNIFSFCDELAAKYPQGRYGKNALKNKGYIKEFIEKRPDLFIAEATQPQEKKPLGVALPITGAAVAAIVIAGLVLFSRKKKQEN